MALLLGPDGARRVLADHGGVIVHDSGEVEAIGPVDGRRSTPPARTSCARDDERTEPLHYLWWLVSRASGIVALVLISLVGRCSVWRWRPRRCGARASSAP